MAEYWDYDAHIKEQGGIKHKDKNCVSYHRISKERWDEIFKPKKIVEAVGTGKVFKWPGS